MLPIVQDQWLNIFQLDNLEFSYYAYLYYFSGLLFPMATINISLNNYLNYEFEKDLLHTNRIRINHLIYPFLFVLITFSVLLLKYFNYPILFLNNLVNNKIHIDFIYQLLATIIIMILLLVNKCKKFLKKLFLFNFFIIAIVIWTNYFFDLFNLENPLKASFDSNVYLNNDNLNIFNIIYLFILEVFYYIWSYFSYKNNLSDWNVSYPVRSDLKPIYQITIIYSAVLIYYVIFNSIN